MRRRDEDLRLLSCELCLLSCDQGLSAHKMPRATPQMSACSSSVQRLAKPTCRWECFWRSLAVCTERPKLMREADRQSGETSCKTDVIITIATSHHRHRSSPSLSPPPSPSEITGPIGREEEGASTSTSWSSSSSRWSESSLSSWWC